jgi:hypothetical protein
MNRDFSGSVPSIQPAANVVCAVAYTAVATGYVGFRTDGSGLPRGRCADNGTHSFPEKCAG